MKTYGDQFIIKYDIGSIRKVEVGGTIIEIAAECNMDIRGNSDQIGVIESAPEGHEFFKKGDTVLTHYLASGSDRSFEYEGITYHRVPLNMIFLRINEDKSFDLNEKIYICEEIVVEAPKSPSGILLTPFDNKREPMRLRALHVPKFSRGIVVGDKLISQDDYQYTFNYDKKKYIQINYDHILATYE
jgi:hypothetical protein